MKLVNKSEADEFGIQIIGFIIMDKRKDKTIFHATQKFDEARKYNIQMS